MTRKNKRKPRPPRPVSSIERPGRYVGREWNLSPIDQAAGMRVVICYPDVYEIGMSHFGLQVLYEVLKNLPGISVERVFAPWIDKEKKLRSGNRNLTTLETGRPLTDCDLLCFTIPHELCFTNILNVIDLGGIPLHRNARSQHAPFILGGGIAALNPLPLEPFFDGFFIGEAEAAIPSIIRAVVPGDRSQTLNNLAEIPGLHLPGLPGKGNIRRTVLKQFLQKLEDAPHPDPPLVPYARPVHERIVVEATRGCPKNCRFCQARVYYHPIRHRSPEKIIELVTKNLHQTGYEEASLLSLNIADYPGIEVLLTNLMTLLAKENVSISLPSLRPERLTSAMIEEIQQVRKTGFTLAPEAGSERLRKIIGKPYPLHQLLQTIESVFTAGWSVIKLYFMIGLPFERDQDIHEMVDLIQLILKIGRRICGSRASVHVSAATFIPKPHTPFQWCGQASETDIRRRQKILRDGCNTPAIKLSMDNIITSQLEACMARGDDRIAAVIESAFRYGCRMDAWNECLDYESWKKAFTDAGLDIGEESKKSYVPGQSVTAWSFIDTGVTEDQLLKSYFAALSASEESAPDPQMPPASMPSHAGRLLSKPPAAVSASQLTYASYTGIFQVISDFRLFSHMEISNSLARAMRRAGLPLAYSHGFNPHPRMSWQPPAPLGFERWCEPVDFDFSISIPEAEILHKLNEQLPPEMRFRSIRLKPDGVPATVLDRFLIALNSGGRKQIACQKFSENDKMTIIEPVDLIPEIREMVERRGLDLVFGLPVHAEGGPTLKMVIETLYGEQEMPLDQVLGARIGWLTRESEHCLPYGWFGRG